MRHGLLAQTLPVHLRTCKRPCMQSEPQPLHCEQRERRCFSFVQRTARTIRQADAFTFQFSASDAQPWYRCKLSSVTASRLRCARLVRKTTSKGAGGSGGGHSESQARTTISRRGKSGSRSADAPTTGRLCFGLECPAHACITVGCCSSAQLATHGVLFHFGNITITHNPSPITYRTKPLFFPTPFTFFHRSSDLIA